MPPQDKKPLKSEPINCPFCNKEGIVDFQRFEGQYHYWITCDTEECRGNVDSCFTNPNEAIASWNTRTPVSEATQGKEKDECLPKGALENCQAEREELEKYIAQIEDDSFDDHRESLRLQYKIQSLESQLQSKNENLKLRIDALREALDGIEKGWHIMEGDELSDIARDALKKDEVL